MRFSFSGLYASKSVDLDEWPKALTVGASKLDKIEVSTGVGLDPMGWTRLILVSDQGKREDLTR